MKTTFRTVPIPGTILFVPSKEQVEALQVGDLAPNAFGEMRVVREIFGRGVDINGKSYVCYYTEFGPRNIDPNRKPGTMSNSMKQDTILCHVGIKLESAGVSRFQDRFYEDMAAFVTEDRTFEEFDRISELR